MDYRDDMRLMISCQGENDALFAAQILLLFRTIRKFGGKLVNGILVANFVKSVDPIVKQSLQDLGVKVTIVERFNNTNLPSNKIRMLEMDDYDYDVLIALDCDTAVVRDFSSEINPEFFQALPVASNWQTDMGILTVQQWQKFLSYLKWNLSPESFNTKKRPIFPYFNGGVLSIPKQYVKKLRKTWGENILGLLEYSQELWRTSDDVYQNTYWFDEIGLSLALEKEKIPFKPLPLTMNFDIHFKDYFKAKYRSDIRSVPEYEMPDNVFPFILHYHKYYDTNGLIMKTGYKMADLALRQINELLRDEINHKTKQFDSRKFRIYKIQLQKVILAKQKLMKTRGMSINAQDIQLKRAMRHVDVLQNINLDNQKAVEDDELKRAIKDVEILQITKHFLAAWYEMWTDSMILKTG